MPTFVTEQLLTATNTWVDVDVSAYIPATATGVMLRVKNTTAFLRAFGLRMNGSTDDRYVQANSSSMQSCFIGVDGSQIFECKKEDSGLEVSLLGYFESEATFFTNAVDVTPASQLAWTNVDVSTLCTATAELVFLETKSGGTLQVGFRPDGSTDDRHADINRHIWYAVGCVSEIFEAYIETATQSVHMVGYMSDQVFVKTNATDFQISATGTWTDFTALTANAVGGFIEVYNSTAANYNYGIRKNGDTASVIALPVPRNAVVAAECDGSGLIEGWIESTNVDFYLLAEFINTSSATKTPNVNKLTFKGYAATSKATGTIDPLKGLVEIKTFAPTSTSYLSLNTPVSGLLSIHGRLVNTFSVKVITSSKFVLKGFSPIKTPFRWSATDSQTSSSWSAIPMARDSYILS